MSEQKIKIPATIACPVCKRRAEAQPPEEDEGLRRFRSYICDTPTCVVSSFRIRYRSM